MAKILASVENNEIFLKYIIPHDKNYDNRIEIDYSKLLFRTERESSIFILDPENWIAIEDGAMFSVLKFFLLIVVYRKM